MISFLLIFLHSSGIQADCYRKGLAFRSSTIPITSFLHFSCLFLFPKIEKDRWMLFCNTLYKYDNDLVVTKKVKCYELSPCLVAMEGPIPIRVFALPMPMGFSLFFFFFFVQLTRTSWDPKLLVIIIDLMNGLFIYLYYLFLSDFSTYPIQFEFQIKFNVPCRDYISKVLYLILIDPFIYLFFDNCDINLLSKSFVKFN